MGSFNEYQYQALLALADDPYSSMKCEIILRYLSDYRNLNILNAGCGSGKLSFHLAQAGHRALGIDPWPQHVQLAQANASHLGLHQCTFAVLLH